jgi:hypothetical protein
LPSIMAFFTVLLLEQDASTNPQKLGFVVRS